MAAEVDDTGTIADTSTDQCSVLVRIDGKGETLSFTKKCLYSYGFQCEGDMTNILDPGTEVNLCYRLSKAGNNPTILAVWIGDKPDQDTLNSDLLEAVYGQEGLVTEVLDDAKCLASGDDMTSTVIINKDVVYRDGCPSSTPLSVGERIIFDALPSESALPSGAKYQATCAWTGSHPRIVDRFALDVKEKTKSVKAEFLQANVIDGTVFVIPNDVVAFVKAEVENVAVEVILFRSSFSEKRGRIQEIVEVGERIRMRLRFAIIFRGKRQWFASKAWKDGEEIPVDDQVDVAGKLAELESLALNTQSSVQPCSVVVGRRSPSPAAVANPTVLSNQPVSGAGYPSAYSNRTILSGYPDATKGYPASWLAYSNSRMMYPANPMMYPYPPAIPIGMVGIPVGTYGYPAFFCTNPAAYARFPPAAVGHPIVQAGLPGNPPVALKLAAESTASMAHKPAIPVIDPSTGFPVVELATPNSRFTSESQILYSDPPLTGIIATNSIPVRKFPARARISHGDIVIAVTEKVVYINQRQCTEEQFMTLIASGKTVVHFESVLNPKRVPKKREIKRFNRPTHLATCVWLGEKPTMTDLLSDMYQPDMSLLGRKDTVFFGRVKKFLLPDIALVEIEEKESTVCVHVSAFSSKSQPKTEDLSEEVSIAHFVEIDQRLSCRIVSVAACPIVLTGIDVKVFKNEKEMKKARALSEQQQDGKQNSTEVSHVKSGAADDDDASMARKRAIPIVDPITDFPVVELATPKFGESTAASMAHKRAIPDVDPSTGFPVVELATPNSRFTSESQILYSDPPLTGIIATKIIPKFPTRARISYGNIVIAASEKVVYINQRQCTEEQFMTLIASGKTVVHFEAVLKWKPGRKRINKPTHLATCVWLGEKPTMIDLLSDMYKPDMSLLGRKDAVIFGRVKKFLLPDIALVEIEEKESTVCVHVSAFSSKSQPKTGSLSEEVSIAHLVKIDLWLSCRIVSVAACPIVLTGIDVKVFKRVKEMKKARALSEQQQDGKQNSTEVSHVKSGAADDDDSSSDSVYETALNTRPVDGSNAENVPSLRTASACSAETLSSLQSAPKTTTESDATQSGHCYQATVFREHSKPQGMPTRFLNWSGTMRIEREEGLTIYKVERVSGFPCNLLCAPKILEVCRLFNTVFAEHDDLGVKFNAECSYVGVKHDFQFQITRIWWDSSISGVDMLYTDLARDEEPKFEHNIPLRAVVTSITQHDAAVAVVDDTPIIIPFEVLRLNEQCPKRNDFSSVDHYLKLGDEVVLTDIKTRFYFSKSKSAKLLYYVAGNCWRAVKIGPSQWDEIKMPEVQEEPSWLDRWLCGEFSRRERVVKKGDRYFVDFVSTTVPNLKLSLDVFENSKFFVNGESKEFDSLSGLEDREIKFHVAHRRDPQNSNNISGEFFVQYAWIGDDPYYLNVLKDELEVPDGLVVDGWKYVAVIEDFVLPTHMICKIGVVPVVVPFPQVAQDVSEVGFQAETSLRSKSQVVVKVRETFYKGLTFLESDFARKEETVFDDSDVLIACKGEVIALPRPEGAIRCRLTKTDVFFHLCSVLPEKGSSLNRNERFEWFKHLKSAIRVGTKVCFSAAKDKEDGDYLAFKVWLE